MVYPVNQIFFKVGLAGLESTAQHMAVVKDMETFNISINSGVEEWTPIDQEGWTRRMMTTKSITVSLSGKRNYGDPGNDYVAGLAYHNGENTRSIMEIFFPNGGVLRFNCIINVTATDGGNAGDVAALEFECLSDGMVDYRML